MKDLTRGTEDLWDCGFVVLGELVIFLLFLYRVYHPSLVLHGFVADVAEMDGEVWNCFESVFYYGLEMQVWVDRIDDGPAAWVGKFYVRWTVMIGILAYSLELICCHKICESSHTQGYKQVSFREMTVVLDLDLLLNGGSGFDFNLKV